MLPDQRRSAPIGPRRGSVRGRESSLIRAGFAAAFKVLGHGRQQVLELRTLFSGEPGKHRGLELADRISDLRDAPRALLGEQDDLAPLVGRVLAATHPALCDERVDHAGQGGWLDEQGGLKVALRDAFLGGEARKDLPLRAPKAVRFQRVVDPLRGEQVQPLDPVGDVLGVSWRGVDEIGSKQRNLGT